MAKKIIITVGGTGGHIFPAIALAKQLAEQNLDLLFVGGNLSINPYFEREAFSYQSISCATFKKKNPWAILKTSTKIAIGIKQSYQILKEYQPDLIVGFGSFYTLPLLLAARMKQIPFILHEANSMPGKVNRLLSKQATAVGIHFPETATHLKGKTYEVGLPLRPGYCRGACSSAQARAYFDLDPHLLTILIFGGSQGAINLNNLVNKAFTGQLTYKKDTCQIIHFAGDTTLAQLLRTDYQKAGLKACVKPFESRMDLAWQAADLSIARAGAGTIAEQMEFEVPGILVPYPFATDNHQEKNADFLVKTVGGAIKCIEKDLTPELLAQQIESLTEDRRERMKSAMHQYKIKYRPRDFCSLILEQLNFQ
jgi:UDP-N-acetylglucosamine--N-acetylmuramyl-(pentapeptide) pyrophosphoryl-undecaprenol N-acetylglucosamine transferase